MAMNPFEERGIPLERQVRTWQQVVLPPYRKQDVDAFTRCRIILMNGIEMEAAIFSHAFARACDDPDLKGHLAALRRVEHQQQNIEESGVFLDAVRVGTAEFERLGAALVERKETLSRSTRRAA